MLHSKAETLSFSRLEIFATTNFKFKNKLTFRGVQEKVKTKYQRNVQQHLRDNHRYVRTKLIDKGNIASIQKNRIDENTDTRTLLLNEYNEFKAYSNSPFVVSPFPLLLRWQGMTEQLKLIRRKKRNKETHTHNGNYLNCISLKPPLLFCPFSDVFLATNCLCGHICLSGTTSSSILLLTGRTTPRNPRALRCAQIFVSLAVRILK